MQIGLIGLGKMGSRMTKKLLSENHQVIVWNRSEEPVQKLEQEFKVQSSKFKVAIQNLKIANSIEDLVKKLEKPRVVWSMLPSGEATESILQEVKKFVEKEDIVADGSNSNYKDTQRRYEELRTKNIRFLGIGVSGGVIAAKTGYPMMVGGNKSAYQYITPILDSLAKPYGGHEYFGTGGAGHFVKMIHNGIEYGFMQSLGEGFDVLKNAPYKFDLIQVGKLWQKGTIISSFLLDRAVDGLEKDPQLSNVIGVLAESGEARWTVEAAKEENVPVKVIEDSLEYRKQSQKDPKIQKSFTAKLIAVIRNEFGGHEIKKK